MRSVRLAVPLVIVTLIAVGLAGRNAQVLTARQVPAHKTVRVAEVMPADVGPGLWFPGVSRAAQRARLSFSMAGRMLERDVAEGDRIARGQVIARLDVRKHTLASRAAAAAVAEARVRSAESERDLARVAQLVEQGAATREELETLESLRDAATAVTEAAAARLADAERQQAEGVLVAPFSGTVTGIFLEPGEYATAGRPVLDLVGEGGVEALFDVPEVVATGLRQGATVAVRGTAVEAISGIGRIDSIGRVGGSPGRLFPVVIVLEEGVPAGVSVEVALSAGGSGELTVPVEAVVDPAGVGPVVFRLKGGPGSATVERVAVSVGALVAGRVVVRSDLAAGDEIVIAGQRGLLDGDPVEVVP